ncbi:MAG: SDR family NAD(P)-dependent oxidoreductase [Pseudomonadota bacterium]
MTASAISSATPDAATLKRQYGPWVLIAGASQGVGAAFARHCASLGLNCVLVARRVAPLEALRDELVNEHGVEVLLLPQDLSVDGAAAQLRQAVGEREIGLFVYNAGGDPYITHFLDTPAADWAALVRLNTQTVMECCHAFGGRMVERGHGGIILLGSHSGLGGVRKLSVYSATKGFGMNLGESLWAEWRTRGVHVLNLVIGATDTPHMRASLAKMNIPGASDIALATPEEVVEAALRQLPDGPTLIYPDDKNTAPGGTPLGSVRREHVLRMSATSAQFIGD